MDTTATIDPPNPQSTGLEPNIGDKRWLDNGDNDGYKRRRFGGEMKRVAEIVLVLSAFGSIRVGGKKPSEVEVELMVEARQRLLEMCEGLAPKDVVGRDSVTRLIEDLGLRSGGRGGFCGSKFSISERMESSKRKMEDSKKLLAHTMTNTYQQTHTNVATGTAIESRVGHVSALPAYQTTAIQVKTTMSSNGFDSSHLVRDYSSSALPRVEGAQFKSEGVIKASSPANNSSGNGCPWSVEHPSAFSTEVGPEGRSSNSNSVKVGGANGLRMFNMFSQAVGDQRIRPFIAQTSQGSLSCTHQPLSGMNLGQAPASCNPHIKIAKTVQKLLQLNHLEHPSCRSPSKDYISKALICQICKVETNEVSSVLVCDACDKGYHVKCVQLINQNGVPRAEWHCQMCLILSKGKPLPPKYGRVTRSTNNPKVPFSTSCAQMSEEKKVATMNSNVAEQKLPANGSPVIQNPTDSCAAGRNHDESKLDAKVSSSCGGQLNNISDKSEVSSVMRCGSAVGSSVPKSIQCSQNLPLSTNERVSLSEINSEPLANPLSPASSFEQIFDLLQLQNCAEESSQRYNWSNFANKDTKVCYSKEHNACTDRSDVRQNDQSADLIIIVGNTTGSGPSDNSGYPSDGLQTVEWVDDSLQVRDGIKSYQSCHIRGMTYKVHDYAFICFGPDKAIPSKLQAMWEDTRTGSKWLIARKCYFPGDLPEIVGRPYTSGSNEVFESNQDSIVKLSLLRGPCEVLTAAKFKEEFEQQNQSGAKSSCGLKPIFLCNWFYDEVKGTFQPCSI